LSKLVHEHMQFNTFSKPFASPITAASHHNAILRNTHGAWVVRCHKPWTWDQRPVKL